MQTACNQTSSRDPVVDYDQPLLTEALRSLKERGLVRVVWADRGPRTLKYHQLLDERLALQPDERALITVLLLRGAQAPGELRTRTERLHQFADREQVETVLRRMAALPTPLVRELERRPGQQDRRWVHLLGPVEAEPAATAAPGRPSTARSCWPTARPRATPRCGRRTTLLQRRTPNTSSTSWTASPSTAGSSNAWPGWPTACRSPTSAPGPATWRRTSRPPGRT